ncbi:MAG: sugar isomerase, partial [Candidatus Margulisbacteria bacterium]|nr:sugar isomerase [Candidatus Margulisiibacteriota bacterium]
EEGKFTEVLIKGVGLPVYAISTKAASFPTIKIPNYDDFTPYLELAMGWNILIEIGLRNKINIDQPKRARKIGNEFME